MALNNSINLAFPVSVAKGGTGLATLTNHGVLLGQGASNLVSLVLAAGQVLIGTTAGDPSAAALTAGSGISISSLSGAITISSTVSGISWATGVTTSTLVAGSGSFVTAGSMQTLTLPTGTAAVGDTFAVSNAGSFATAWRIAQAAGQGIKFGSSVTTTGTGGSLTSSAVGDTLTLVCYDSTANVEQFMVIESMGNITVV